MTRSFVPRCRALALLSACGAVLAGSNARATPSETVRVSFGELDVPAGASPFQYVQPRASTYIHGELHLVVSVRSDQINPFCYTYSVAPNVEAWTPPSPTGKAAAAAPGGRAPAHADVLGPLEKALALLNQASGYVDQLWGLCSVGPPKQAFKQQRDLLDKPLGLSPDGLPDWYGMVRDAVSNGRRWAVDNHDSKDNGKVAETVEGLAKEVATLADTVLSSVLLAHRLADFAPAPFEQTYPVGKAVTIQVKRRALVRGQADKDGPEAVFQGQTFKTLSPIYVDVGVGPSYTFRRKVDYGAIAVPQSMPTSYQVAETNRELNVDGVVTLSFYYCPRWLDEERAALRFLLPRPALGLSLSQRLTSLYAGLQVDPYQFVDITFGLRWFSQPGLIDDQKVGDMVGTNSDGTPQALAKSTTTTRAWFVSLTASTDLFTRWIAALGS
jgi:hypothetical protein